MSFSLGGFLSKCPQLQSQLLTNFQLFRRVRSIGSLPPENPRKIPRTPAEPRRAPQNPRRDPAEPSERPPQSPLRGKFSRRVSRRVVAPRMVTLRNFRTIYRRKDLQGWPYQKSLSPKAGHNKAGRSDFRNQRFEPDTAKMRKMRKTPLTLQKQGFEETPHAEQKRGKCG